MKNKIIKLICIFLLIISMFRTGLISEFLNDINLYLFGGTYFWVVGISIAFIIVSFFKPKTKVKLRKYLIAIVLAGISAELIFNLIKIELVGDINYTALVEQTLFEVNNIQDKIGFIPTFFEVSLNTLFGNAGIFVMSFVLIIIAVLLSLDVDTLFKNIINFFKNGKSKKYEDDYDDYYDETIDLKKIQKSQKTTKPKKATKSKVTAKASKKEKPVLQTEKKSKVKEKNTSSVKENSVNSMFEPKRPIGNKAIKSGTITKKTDIARGNIKKKEQKIAPLNSPVQVVDKKENKATTVGLKNNKSYTIPPVSLLKMIKNNEENYKIIESEAKKKGKLLLDTLESFKVKAVMKDIIIGSSITRYELQPEIGQKVSKFSNLNNDLAMALSARSIRIEAPIPGKPLVGIEVPNKKRLMVGLRELIGTSAYNKTDKLNVALGKNIEGKPKYLNIEKAPHLLVAGATGSGKSVCINSIITNILFNATPEEVKFLLIDPKKVELTPYDGIPHLLTPVITDPEKAAVSLNKLVYEMEKRYDLFAETKTRNIKGYNKIQKDNQLPYIVAIIDELADLMMVSSTEVEVSISRIAQKARAAGIHLILATQRPSTDVITGLIKSNIPTRISFMVSSSIDSRTILDRTGAEKLLGNGDMLVSENGSMNFDRIQGAYLSDEEIADVVKYVTEQFKDEDMSEYYKEDFLKLESEKKSITFSEDSLLYDAMEMGIEHNKMSTSMLQRNLRVGFNRATTIIEQLEAKGWISPVLGNNKPREILISKERFLEERDNQ